VGRPKAVGRPLGQVERLLAQLESYRDLTLAELKRVAQTWLERDYRARVHPETG
jgi:hypothetical protein